jgi:hypothetical protein
MLCDINHRWVILSNGYFRLPEPVRIYLKYLLFALTYALGCIHRTVDFKDFSQTVNNRCFIESANGSVFWKSTRLFSLVPL